MEHNRRILIAPRIRLDKLCSVNMQWHDHMPSSPGEHVQQVGSFERRIFRIYNRENSVTDEILEQLLSAAPGQQTLNKRRTGLVWEQQRTRPHQDGHRRFPRRIFVWSWWWSSYRHQPKDTYFVCRTWFLDTERQIRARIHYSPFVQGSRSRSSR